MTIIFGYYTDAEIKDALLDGQRTWLFFYHLFDRNGGYKKDLTVISCTVEQNAQATGPKMTAKIILPKEQLTGVDLYTDKVDIRLALLMPDGWYQEFKIGTFHLSTTGKTYKNQRQLTEGGTIQSYSNVTNVEITGYDSLLVLAEDAVLDRYVVTAGTSYITAVRTLLSSSGFNTDQIEYDANTLPADQEWPPGTPKLTIINNLLAAINFGTLYMDFQGIPGARKWVDPNVAPTLFTYSVDRKSVIIPGIDIELDLFNIPNVWVAFVSDPDRPVLRSVYTNSDPNSPLSTVSRGRSIVQIVEPDRATGEEEMDQSATQALLDAKVARIANEATQQYEMANFDTGLMPIHSTDDVCILDYGWGYLKYKELSWSMELKIGGVMKHSFRRVVTV